MSPRHALLMLAVTMAWGFNFVAAKVGLDQFPPLLYTALRFMIVAALLFPFLRWHKGKMGQIALIAVFAGFLHFGLVFTGLSYADASVAGILAQLSVPFLTLLSIFVLREVVRWRRWSGIIVAFAGVLVIGFEPRVLAYWEGVAFMTAGAFVIAVGMMLMRQLKGVGVFDLQAWIAVISVPVLSVLSLLIEGDPRANIADANLLGWSTVVYTAVGASILGHGGMYFLLQRYEASLVGPLTLLAPVFAVVFAVAILGDPLTPRFIIGAGLTLLGCTIIALRQGRTAPPAPPAPAAA